MRLFAGGALERGGLNVGVGLARRLARRVEGELDVEWSPWFEMLSRSTAPGTTNVYASVGVAWVLTPEVEVRTVGRLGTSVLLFSPLGAEAGAVGLYGALGPVSLSMKLAPRWWLDVSPEVALSMPSLGGIPFVYRQYLLRVGFLRWL